MNEAYELPLRSYIKANAINIQQFFSIALQVMEMLRERHQNEVGFFQITSENLFVRFEDGQLTLRRGQQQQSSSNEGLAYISPEHTGRMKRKVDLRSNLYVVGILFYELLTGELPLKANSASDWIYAHMAMKPVPPRVVNLDIPKVLNDLVMKLLSKSVEDRYQSVYGLLDDLNKCSDQWIEKGTIDLFPLGVVDERSRFRLPDRIYGRDLAWQQLIDAYERSSSGSKELLFIGGHAGSGKSMLVKAFQSHVMQNKGYVVFGKYEPLQKSKPYAAFVTAISVLIRQIMAGGEEQVARWRTKLLKALGQSGSVLTQVISELTWIIGEQPSAENLSPLEATNRFQMLFGNLIKVFADELHPLVIGLEDLQWADSASLQLIQDLWNHASLKHVLIIGTYRDDELDVRHAFRKLVFEQSDSLDIGSHFMNIHALGHSDVVRYVADMLHDDLSEIKPLAEVLYRQTAGNPFYLTQMLQTYYDQGLLFFNSDKLSWNWQIEEIRQMEGFHDVIDLIVRRLETLPEETRQVLGLAGCLESSFDRTMISTLCGKSANHTEQILVPAVSEGLIVAEENSYRFLHDQVQEAAYHLLPDDEKKRIHLKVGRFMLRSFHLDNPGDRLFEIVHHLNAGSEYMTDPAEVDQLAHLNLEAGKKAKASAAYSQALELLKKGTRLTQGEGPSRSSSLYFELVLESAECRYFFGDFDQAEIDLLQLLRHAELVTDRTRIYVILIMMYTFYKKEKQAVEIALQAMTELGMAIPSHTSRGSILAEIARTQLTLAKQRNQLKALPMSNDPLQQALAEVVMVSSAVIFVVDAELAVIMFARYVRMSLKQGLGEAFSIALGSYAITMALGFGWYGTALRLAEVARHYAEQSDRMLLKGRIEMIRALVLQFLHPQEITPIFEKAVQLSTECGDMVSAGNSVSCHIIAADGDLRRLERICNTYEEQYANMLDEMTLRVLQISKRYAQLLERKTEVCELSFDIGNAQEDRMLKEELLSEEHKGNRYYFYTCKLEVAYVYARYAEAASLAEHSKHLEANMLLSVKQRHCFYHALAVMAIYPEASERSKRTYRKTLHQLLKRMKRWAKIVPDSTLSKYYAMQAEYARVNHEHGKASKLYNQAIHYAREAGEPRDEATAAELAANFHLTLNDHPLAEVYLRNACEAYFRWGATGKLNSLQERYPALAALSFKEWDEAEVSDRRTEEEMQPWNSNPHAELGKEMDMEILRQANKIQSGDLAETELLETFLQLAIHNTGAERGLVLLSKLGELVIEAQQETNGELEISIDRRGDYASSVVQFVMKTRESVILGEARDSLFEADPHIQEKRPRSILCLPVRYLDHRDGVLYLENNLTPDAFTAERLEVLEMIFSRLVYLRLWQIEEHGDSHTGENQAKETLVELLTSRELEIVRLMAEGLSNKQIALHLDITEGTVKSHANNIYGKLQVNKRVQAIKKARELQLLN
ncbi:AAA family ATPase [Paenibacillus sp. LMG 31460]|uniref:AAA family ATPase n=1 Tax=Paenibacillus germinis TaxID=2654979 RepID=A0ABX1Z674_9BACL|nr:AAA family ATPase [Paenibacillus germinis]NOU87365.1 AAA family ATPase [Paenibacillus germinis]